MSGGAFDYNQHKIRDIYEEIENEINKMGTLKPKDELRYYSDGWFDKYPEDKYYHKYSEEIINESNKLNAAVGFPISSVMTEKNDNSIFLFMIHTAYGSISFIVTIDDAENVIGKEELSKLEHIGVM